MSTLLTIGITGTSRKEDERRVAIHPEHLHRLPRRIREQMTFETGYGSRFGVDDDTLAQHTSGRVAPRNEILENFDLVLIPKPVASDLLELREEAVLCGWTHCVQQRELTEAAIARRLTLIAWENMHVWSPSGRKKGHVFSKNNELAGYAGVNHALSLVGINGHYGKPIRAAVLGFGSVGRGAVYALRGQGIHDIAVYTGRRPAEVNAQVPGLRYRQMIDDDRGHILVEEDHEETRLLAEALSEFDVIVNAILQDTNHPKTFVRGEHAHLLKKGTLIIDISCDEGMGFWCARPTSFEHPILEVEGKYYYAVDHTPSFYWRSASWEISSALLPFLPAIAEGPEAWKNNTTISRAIEMRSGVIQNPKILSFQDREKEYPHRMRALKADAAKARESGTH